MLTDKVRSGNWMVRVVAVLVLLAASSVPAPAQALTSVNYVTQVQALVDQMVGTNIGFFVSEGRVWLMGITALMMFYMLILNAFASGIAKEKMVEFILLFFCAYTMLLFYDSPLPWTSSSFHSLFADTARWIDGMIDIHILNDLTASLKTIIDNAEVPVGFDVIGFIAYAGLLVDVSLLWFFSFGLTAASYIALAIGSMLGPLFIPFLMWPFMSWLFMGWLRYMVIYAIWRVMATAVIAVFANVSVWFLANIIGGDLSIGHIIAIVPAWTAIDILCLYVLWISHSLARDMVSGSASMGNPFTVVAGSVAAWAFR
jgi:hypothetical protein